MTDVVFDIGHFPYPGDTGAYNSTLDICEHDWCYGFALACRHFSITKELFNAAIVTRKTNIADLCKRINHINPKFVLSFHLNGYSLDTTSGTECFYWHTSQKSKKAAELFQTKMVTALGLRNRGAKPSTLYQLGAVKAPMVLIEPGFLTCRIDMYRMVERYQELIKALTYGIWEVLNDG